eukprot:TRINITY_DN1051_c0_g1_i7.p1 TRINITY_DN1051_c0_g1~~TRINITY_DN1051_c0_g1_i7.p1  ORF type:complete len:205 (-),score=62.50 TRINITY_DN1051_c0_g1_i7:60-674(-)
MKEHVLITIFFFSSRRRHTRCSGVSWARRCVQETAPYQHKRILSVWDINLWWYDNVMPEYAFTYQDQHVHDQFKVFTIWGEYSVYILSYLLGFVVFYNVCCPWVISSPSGYDLPQATITQVDTPINDALKRIDEKRYAAKRSFTGQDITGEDGVFSTTLFRYSKSKEELENAIKLILIKRQINAEARNYVQRIEREVREKCNTL